MLRNKVLLCDMEHSCVSPVTHLDHKGYVYCADHGYLRKRHRINCRKLRPHELKRLHNGKQVTKY